MTTVPAATGSATTDAEGHPIAAPQTGRWLVFGIVSVAFLMSSIDQTIVATALPALQHDLHTQLNWAGWTITAYALGRVVVLPLSGRLSDMYGRRTIFLASVAVFTAASLGCGLAGNIYVLIVLRAVQSVGGGAFMPSATGIVSDKFGRDRDRAIGLFTSIFPIGGLIGPVLGGVFVQYWSWRGIFLVNVPIGVFLLALAARFLPSGGRTSGAGRPDIRGMILLVVVVLSAMLAVTELGEPGARLLDVRLLLATALAVASGFLLVAHMRRAAEPFILPSLLHGGGLGVLGVINVVYGGAALGLSALVPLYASQRYGIGTLASGTLLSARAVGVSLASTAAVWALRRTGYRKPIRVGFVLVAGGLVLLALPPAVLGPFGWLSLGACIAGIGMGISNPASNNASLELAPGHVAALAGLRAMFRQCGSIVAVSVTTAILARVSDPGIAQAYVYAAFAAILVCVIPLVVYIPEHRGTW